MQRRLDKLAIDGDVRREGAGTIAVELPPQTGLPQAIYKRALLEFYDFEAALTGPSVTRGPVRAPIARSSLAVVPEGTVVVSCKVAEGNCLSVRQVTTEKAYYLFRNTPELTGGDVKLSDFRADIDPNTNAPVVVMRFTEQGARTFQEVTRREAKRGALVCKGQHGQEDVLRCSQHFAIVLDHEILTMPYIDFFRNPDGIPGDNGAQIDLGRGGTLREAKRIAVAIQTGALPVRFVRLP
jgi:preprotein translocase subunit SecD